MKDFGVRLLSTLISVAIVVSLIVFAENLFARYLITLFVALLTGIAIWEYEQLAKAKGGKMMFLALAGLSVGIIFSFFLATQSMVLKNPILLVVFLSIWALFALHFREKEGAIVDLAVSLFGLFYVAVPMGMMLWILFMPGSEDGRLWLAYLLAVTKITDIGAYFFGSLWGKRKLAPTISPGKTVEGAIFGWICALAMSFTFYLFSKFSGYFHLSFVTSLWLGAVLGIASQFGDLSESHLKRDAQKKDSNQLPGIGGVLDMIDSLIFNAPILYIYLQ